ncbi:MAG TPA: DUF1385 domain-containing protein [Acidobacteriota bacterium]|nr:DUF1385 domain-containing protein [Acidobacteriota bacterium]
MVKPIFGGQAVMEGVFFKSASAISLAVRKPNKSIYTWSTPYTSWAKRAGVQKIPLIRGIVVFVEMMILGTKMLNRSAEIALDEKDDSSSFGMILAIVAGILGIVIAIGLFKFLPLLSTTFLWRNVQNPSAIGFTLVEGLIKLTLFLIYLIAIGQMNDIKRLFQYHGAEHKVIRCFEADKKLTIENVAKSSRYHPRCGTSFLVFVIGISILLYTLIPLSLPLLAKLGIRLLFLPLIAGIAFEIITLTAKVSETGPMRWLLWPGYFVQSLTTREPDRSQIQVALASFNACVKKSK